MTNAKVYYLHEGLPRQAPGSDDSTWGALRRLGPIPADAVVLDVGCGPGRSALALALCLKARVTAIDIHQPCLDELSAASMLLGVSKLVTPRKRSMANMKLKPGTFDLIWAEGSAYFLGIRRSLETWLPLLNDDGHIAFTELCWCVRSSGLAHFAHLIWPTWTVDILSPGRLAFLCRPGGSRAWRRPKGDAGLAARG